MLPWKWCSFQSSCMESVHLTCKAEIETNILVVSSTTSCYFTYLWFLSGLGGNNILLKCWEGLVFPVCLVSTTTELRMGRGWDKCFSVRDLQSLGAPLKSGLYVSQESRDITVLSQLNSGVCRQQDSEGASRLFRYLGSLWQPNTALYSVMKCINSRVREHSVVKKSVLTTAYIEWGTAAE